MSDKFKNVPLDDDTRVLLEEITKLGEYEIMHQMWNWDGIKGESIIFADADIKDLSEEEIKEKVRSSPMVTEKESNMTFSQKGSGYTFVNFNFDPD